MSGFSAPGIGLLANGGYAPGRYYHQLCNGQNATLVMAANTIYFVPFPFAELHTFDRIAAQVTATGTATLIRLGVYLGDGLGKPGALAFDAGTVGVGSTGLKSITISQPLLPKVCWGAVVADGSVTISGSACHQVSPYFTGVTDFATPDAAVNATLTFGALPATAFAGGMGAITYSSGVQNPTIGLRA